MTPDEAIKILRHGVDGMGNEGPEYGEIADLLEQLAKQWRTMTFNEIRAAAGVLLPMPDSVVVRLPESEGSSPEAITSTETSGLPARQSGSPEVDPSGKRLKYLPCPLVFKGKDCGYTGSEQNCNKTYESCRDLLNLPSFRGWPIRQLCGQDLGPSEGIIGTPDDGEPADEAEHFETCPICGQAFDARVLDLVIYHDQPVHEALRREG